MWLAKLGMANNISKQVFSNFIISSPYFPGSILKIAIKTLVLKGWLPLVLQAYNPSFSPFVW
jgi:hypothetical protein